MGRAKLDMKLITKEKSRNVTFKKRKEGLIRKMHEFTTLCDVSACMIIYGPKQEAGFTEPEIWPPNPDEVHRIIDIYKSKSKDSGNKTFSLSDFFHDRNRRIEDELAKLRKKNTEARYPTWLEFMNFMPEARLRDFAAALSSKAVYVNSKIELLRRNNKEGVGLDMNPMDLRLAHPHIFNPTGLRGVELEIVNQQAISSHLKPVEMHVPIHYPAVDHRHELHAVNQNSMMMLLMNDNDRRVQFGGGGNIQCAASYKRQFFYEAMDPASMICHSPKPLSRYYGPSLSVPVVGTSPYLQMQFPAWENNNNNNNDRVGGDVEEDVAAHHHHHQYPMNYNRGRYYDY